MTALKEVAGLYSACGVRDCPVAIVAAAGLLKPTCLAMPVCHSECRAAGILSAAGTAGRSRRSCALCGAGSVPSR